MAVSPVPIRRGLRAVALVLGLAAIPWGLLAADTTDPAGAQTPGPPNIVLVLTDDQRFNTLRVMPEVRRLLMARGMTLRRAIVTNPLCCPSRAAIFTGRYSHTSGVYTNGPPSGGWSAFKPSESNTIATALHDVGYRTALIGKYLNGYKGDAVYVPPGWDRWFAFTGDPGYFDYSVYDDTLGGVSYGSRPRDYSTDVLRRQAVAFIRGVPQGTPFFLVVTPYAPHGPSLAAPRHEGVFASAPVWLGSAVNEADVSDKPAYISGRPVRSVPEVRRRTRDQWETLLAVDELVSRIMATLVDTGRGSNTLVIFTSDNGFSNREHRWGGKQVPYEESIRVPMVVRLPGSIPPDTVSRALVSNIDLAPTIADFAGASISADGVSMRPLLIDPSSSVRDVVLLEHLQGVVPVPTYCGVRTSSFTFVHYVTGEEELYDLVQDPHQLRNVASRRPNRTAQLRALTGSLCRPVPPGFSW
jgi:N-acetylglucosamine-6-sulfatase